MTAPLLDVQHLTVVFDAPRGALTAVQDVDGHVQPGKVLHLDRGLTGLEAVPGAAPGAPSRKGQQEKEQDTGCGAHGGLWAGWGR